MSLDQERRLEEILRSARDLSPQGRTVFLKGACGTMQNRTGKQIRCLLRTNKASSLSNIGQECGNV